MAGNAGIPLHERQEGGLEDIRSIEFISVLAQKEDTLINELTNNQSHNLSQISSRNKFLKQRLTITQETID
jgi:hypothetical protein